LTQGDKIISTSARFVDDVRQYHSGHSWIFDPAVSGGGVLMDCGINILSIFLDLLGPLDVDTVSLITPDDQIVERECTLTFFTADKKPVSLYYDWLSPIKPAKGLFEITFESGTKIDFEWISGQINKAVNGKTALSLVADNGTTEKDKVPMDLEYIEMLADGLRHIKKEKVQLFKNNDAFHLTMLCYEKGKSTLKFTIK